MSLDKFRKSLEKKEKFNIGFSEIPDWICTGNLALNEIISGDPRKGFPVARSTMISGLQGTGKSFLVANAAKNAQAKGYFVVYLDTENSVGEEFMTKIGVDMSPEAFLPINVYSIEESIEIFADFLKNTLPTDKVCFIVDSLSNLETEKDLEKFDAGNVAYGQGLKEKLYKQMVRNINSKIGNRNTVALFVTHMYVNGSDSYGNPILKPSCGSSTLFIPSVGIELSKVDLKEGKTQIGVTVRAKTYKTRYTQLGKKTQFNLPWDTGMDLYDGILPVFEARGVVQKNGAWYSYTDPDSEDAVKFQSKNLHDHVEKIMRIFGDTEVIEMPEEDASVEMEESKD